MKRRDYKDFALGKITHIYNRGNNKEKIFYEESDYKAFLFRLGLSLGVDQKILQKESILSVPFSRIRINGNKDLFKIHSFCLMPNHFHLIIEQCGEVSVSKFIGQICTSYAMYINKKYKRVGHVFQDKFKSVPIGGDSQLMWTSAYIHMNPVKDKLVKNPEEYKWSSYNDFVLERNLPIVFKDFILSIFGEKEAFKKETLNFVSKINMSSMSRPGLDMSDIG